MLEDTWPDDPFEPVPVLVGSRGMERWLRHELATRLGGIACVDFLFPRAVFDGAARWLTGNPGASDRSVFWERPDGAVDPWSGAPLRMRVLRSLRARVGEPRFARRSRYLGGVGEAVRAREIAFAEEVCKIVERLLYDRPEDALAWAKRPARAPDEHAWLACILSDLHREAREPSPAQRLEDVQKLRPVHTGRALFVFCLSTLRPGDKLRIAELSRHLEVHLFALAPSSEWWQDIRQLYAQRAALRDTRSPSQTSELLAALRDQNVLLAASGEPSRDLQVWLETLAYDEPVPTAPLAAAPTLLGRLHRWIDRAEDNPRAGPPAEAPWRDSRACPSFEVHACHNPLRQCEALRDELLRRFAVDPTLEPRHVLVMTPDVGAYAPLVAAVFARAGGGTPAIPVTIADLGIRATNPVADALLQVLALAEERVTATRLLEILAVAPVRARFGLGEDDLADLRTLIVESGIRWAWDATDRGRHDQPGLDQNTVRFGLERLALGVLMHDPGGLATVPAGPDGTPAPAVPLEVSTRERAARFGRLADICARLEGVRGRVARLATSQQWRDGLRGLLDDFTRVEDAAAWLRGQVDDTLAGILPDDGDEPLRLDPAAVGVLLQGAFGSPAQGDRPVTGAVTVCALEPMRWCRSASSRSSGSTTARSPGRGARRRGIRSRRRGRRSTTGARSTGTCSSRPSSARETLSWCSGTASSRCAAPACRSRSSRARLSRLLAAGVGCTPDDLLTAHPLQPWSEKVFADRDRLPFDTVWVDAARALRGERVEAGLAATALAACGPRRSTRSSR